ncbi:MAG: RusA family crossover junction endodeoxyribonuclease, partial [Anaerovoracaceae bacterium]
MISFTVPGAPFGKQRPRVTKFGTYTPKETINYENLVKTCCTGNPFSPEAALIATVRAFFSIPKSTSQKDREKMIQGIIRPTKKPDNDN